MLLKVSMRKLNDVTPENECQLAYLESSFYIDWKSDAVLSKALEIAAVHDAELDLVRACFEFVRDEIRHSLDFQLNPVTCKASEVLLHGTGFCFAKSHLLAALLRGNGIPTALCYQRIAFGEHKTDFYLHGLNAVFMKEYGWYRLDPRGNKAGVASFCSPPLEILPFQARFDGECLFEEKWVAPNPNIISLLESCATYSDVLTRLPEVTLLES